MKELENTVVHLQTQKEYDEYMQMCEDAGWVWGSGTKIVDSDYWHTYKKETCVEVRNKMSYSDVEYHQGKNDKIITLKELKKLNNIKTTKFMSIKDTLKKLTLGEPNKTFYKAGLMDVDGNWNQEVKDFALDEILTSHMQSTEFQEKMLKLANEELTKDSK